MTLEEELDEAQAEAHILRCGVCKFLAGREDREAWDAALRNTSRSHAAFARVFARHDFRVAEASVAKHRRDHAA